MHAMTRLALVALLLPCLWSCTASHTEAYADDSARAVATTKGTDEMSDKVVKTEEEWKQILTPEEYRILREKGTERAFTGDLLNNKKKGTYVCAACGKALFDSDTKFESGTGWPSFWQPIDGESVASESDRSHFMVRTEVLCNRCGGHLGHVFPDGPKPTGQRYCINSASLDFEPEDGKE